MRVVIQRVTAATVTINEGVKASIKNGLLLLLGIEEADTQADIDWLCGKITNLRIFNDSDDIMNLSVKDIDGEILLVSQFTLHASTKKGNRPSYIKAAKADQAIPLYHAFITTLEGTDYGINKQIQTGTFGADMKVSLINDGPVTICIDSKNKE
jgi:D-aminoacyl-tRNA deacylase